MLLTLAVSGHRSLRDLVLPLDRLNVVSGANGSGKSSLYKVIRLLATIEDAFPGSSVVIGISDSGFFEVQMRQAGAAQAADGGGVFRRHAALPAAGGGASFAATAVASGAERARDEPASVSDRAARAADRTRGGTIAADRDHPFAGAGRGVGGRSGCNILHPRQGARGNGRPR